MRWYTEPAMMAVPMAHEPSYVSERDLRSLVFVELREMAAHLIRILSMHYPFVYEGLLFKVPQGQKSGKDSVFNYTALFVKFCYGEAHLIFSTTGQSRASVCLLAMRVVRYPQCPELGNSMQSCILLRREEARFSSPWRTC
ncbi:hypothetical protein ABL78_1479 [Leptomonas seymouri]|uniref:Uncharacterized protein n=1 Tax=Leptomonas seymouri TaxID=5684 RepID=A0A0N1IAM6_LEPSE|nr:hypothetical protein ABL78_1479 [Leptomonas seymouri]|eukprot:KPI89443.1 hypothetical protein ABL78_1479 [Leptomonas seymouri]